MVVYFVIMGKFTKFELLIAINHSFVININLPVKDQNGLIKGC